MCQFVVYFGRGLKIGRKRRGREMTPSMRPSCLQSIKVLSFVILIITTVIFKVWEENLEYRSGRGGGWFLIAECNDDPENPLQEPFTLEIACKLIGETEQEEGI